MPRRYRVGGRIGLIPSRLDGQLIFPRGQPHKTEQLVRGRIAPIEIRIQQRAACRRLRDELSRYRRVLEPYDIRLDGVSVVANYRGAFASRVRQAGVDGLVKALAEKNGNYPGIATHDPAIINECKRFVTERGIDHSRFEFQMLYGVRRDLQEQLVKEGYRMRVYVPFGTQWYPYLMRRLAERPANVAFITGNVVREMIGGRN